MDKYISPQSKAVNEKKKPRQMVGRTEYRVREVYFFRSKNQFGHEPKDSSLQSMRWQRLL